MEESLRHPENPILETKEYLRQSLTDHASTGHNSSAEPGDGSEGLGIITANICRYCLYSAGLQITHRVDAGTALQADSIRKAW